MYAYAYEGKNKKPPRSRANSSSSAGDLSGDLQAALAMASSGTPPRIRTTFLPPGTLIRGRPFVL